MNNSEKTQMNLSVDDAKYIEELITRNEYIIRAAVRAVLRDKYTQIGEDCIGEIYLLACEKIAVLKEHAKPDGWILVASRKVALSSAKKHNALLNKIADEDIDSIPSEDDVFEDALYSIWLDNGEIDRLLEVLTPREREIYDLLYIKNLSPKRSAEVLGISESTIRNTGSNIKTKIKNAMKTRLF